MVSSDGKGDSRLKPWTEYHTLMKKVVDRCIPQTAVVELTYRCNFKCVQCYIVHEAGVGEELTLEEYDSLFKQLAEAGTLYLILTGGEIFVRRDLWEIMDLTRKYRFATHLFTNGYALTEENVERLDTYGNLIGMSISVYGGDRESFEKITKVKGSFDRVIAGIRRLADRGIKLRIKTPIIDTNYCSLDLIREFCDDLELAHKATPMITPKDDGDLEPIQYRLNDESMADYLRRSDLSYLDGRIPRTDVPVCSAGRSQVSISPMGEVFPCVQIRQPGGSIRQESFKEIWESDAFDFIRNLTISKVAECMKCKDLKYCNPCYGLGWTEHGTVYKPSKEICRITRIVRDVYLEKKKAETAAARVVK